MRSQGRPDLCFFGSVIAYDLHRYAGPTRVGQAGLLGFGQLHKHALHMGTERVEMCVHLGRLTRTYGIDL